MAKPAASSAARLIRRPLERRSSEVFSSLFDERKIQNIIKDSHANIVTVSREFFVIEKTGRRHETEQLYQDLKPYRLMQFVRSGRIAVTKEPMNISEMLAAF